MPASPFAPAADSQFDLVFSADVLEHLRPDQADAVVRELVSTARRGAARPRVATGGGGWLGLRGGAPGWIKDGSL